MKRKFFVLVALLLVVISRVMLLILPLSLLRRMLFDRPIRLPRLMRSDATTIASVIDSAARRVPRSTCLVRTLAGRLFFSLAGLPSRAHLGATKGDDDCAPSFHAWLEHDGRAVIGAMPAMPRSFFA